MAFSGNSYTGCFSIQGFGLKAGYMLLARETAERGWPLFRVRPKLHMQGELVCLAMTVASFMCACCTNHFYVRPFGTNMLSPETIIINK